MFKTLELQNFKAFGQQTEIPLAPITLIFGENSSGKSSIIQSLSLLKQTRESREVGALLLPRTDHGFADLGSFQDLIFDHDLARTLSMKLTYDFPVKTAPPFITRIITENKLPGVISLEISFRRPKIEDEVLLHELKFYLGNDERPVAIFSSCTAVPESVKKGIGSQVIRRDRRIRHSKLGYAKCIEVNAESKYWISSYEHAKKYSNEMLQHLKAYEERVRYTTITKAEHFLFPDIAPETATEKSAQLKEIRGGIKFYESPFTLKQYIERMTKKLHSSYIGLDGFIPTAYTTDSGVFLPEHCCPIVSKVAPVETKPLFSAG